MNKLLILLLLTISLSTSYATQYRYEDYIYKAIEKRNSYYKDIIPVNNRIRAYNNPDTWYKSLRPMRSQWYFFLKGINDLKKGKPGNENFHRAIKEADYDLGNLWVLFLEFEKIDQREWSNLTIEKMHKALTTSASSEAPTIVDQLLILAKQAEANKSENKASYYIQTALKFTDTTSPILATALINGIDGGETKITPVTVISTYMSELKENWYIQTHLYKALFIFIRGFITVSTIILFILIFIKYYPKVIHTLACRYPLTVPYKIRIVFISLLLFPLFIFGGYITAIFTSFALLMYIDSKEYKRLISIVIVGFILFPLLTYPEAIIEKILEKDAVHNLYYKSLREIPSNALEKKVSEWQQSDDKGEVIKKTPTQEALLFTSQAIINFKQKRINEAQFYINKAMKLRPDLQPTIIAASVINMIGKNRTTAEEQFNQCLEKFPNLAEAHFNYNRWILNTSRDLNEANTHLTKATELSQNKILKYPDMNTLYFGEHIPFTREYIISTMDSKTFWKNRSSLISSSTLKAKRLWGDMFLGLNPIQSAGILTAIFIILIIRLISTSSRRAAISKCSLCGRPTCKHCKCAEYCNECNTLMKSISNESLIESMKIKISINKRLTARIIGITLQMLFPGSAAFFINGKPPLRAFPMLIITLFVYTTYVVLFSYTFSLFPETSLVIKLIILGILSLYNIFFILQFFTSLKHEKSAGKA